MRGWLKWALWNVCSDMPRTWPHNAVAAVSFTFDGSTADHLEVASRLERAGHRATFYVDPTTVLEAPAAWRAVGQAGHELGNHALFAACDDDGLLIRMSEEAIAEELDEARALLESEFGSVEHSAAMPLVATLPDDSGVPAVPELFRRSIVRLNEEAMGELVRSRYDVVRSPLDRFNEADVDLQRLRCCRVDGLDAVTIGLIAQIGISTGAWILLSWGPNPDSRAVAQVSTWLRRQPVWVAPVIEIARHVRAADRSRTEAL